MCRHLAYLGPPVALRTLLFDAPRSLAEQGEHPWHQPPGRVNKDGWGVGWYGPDGRIAGFYRTVTPMWDDPGFADGDATSTCVLAAARLASPGAELDPTGNAPFRADGWLFSLNGWIGDFRDGVEAELRAGLSDRRRDAIEGDTDSEVVFALVLDLMDAGDRPQDAIRAVIERVTDLADAKLNLLLTDGEVVHGARYGNSLFVKPNLIASERLDDDVDWREVPDHHTVCMAASTGAAGDGAFFERTWTAL